MNKTNFKNNQPIAIVANDAGAANLILGWIKKNQSLKFNFCLTGPAEKILSKEISFENNNNLDEALRKCNLLISGTSYFSTIEHDAREKAKKLKIHTIAIVDHWVNYRSRFIRKGKTVLPDNIWVFDDLAEKIARKTFSKVIIERHENFYLENMVNKIESFKKNIKLNGENILYVLEPIRKKSIDKYYPYEFLVLDFFLNNLDKMKISKPINIKLRLHPSEKLEKYKPWIENIKKYNKEINISITSNMSLEEDIANADIVIGYETYALVIASAAGKRCFTSKLPNENECRLNIENIEYLRDIN